MGISYLPEVVIFDFDGTLVDSEGVTYDVCAPILTKYLGRPFSKTDMNDLKGKAWRKIFMDWFPQNYDNVYQEIFEIWKTSDPKLPLYPGITGMLENLKGKGVRMAIASSREHKLISNYLKRLSISEYFEYIVGQEDTEYHKPHPAPLLMASQLMGIETQKCLYVGDQVADIQASRAAGMMAGGASWGEGVYSQLIKERPDHIFKEPIEITGIGFRG